MSKILDTEEIRDNVVRQVIERYKEVLSGDIEMAQGKAAIGLIISYHKQNEKNDGLYDSRIVSIFSRDQRMVTLNLIYKTNKKDIYNQVYFSLVPQGDGISTPLISVHNSNIIVSDKTNIDDKDEAETIVQRLPFDRLPKSPKKAKDKTEPTKTQSREQPTATTELSRPVALSEMTMPAFSDAQPLRSGEVTKSLNSNEVLQKNLLQIIDK